MKAYFDVGNVVIYRVPAGLDPHARLAHRQDPPQGLRDGSQSRTFDFKNLGEGDIDWLEVRRALGEIGYSGYMTTEIKGGDLTYLKDVSARVDRIIAGQKPVATPSRPQPGNELAEVRGWRASNCTSRSSPG